ncbi:enoyl-CoA hydratase/isomerase family protein [Halioglobus maricola]|nr:enoyl-CoA hydratase/isomerase family protein [Halioglobus maricola]
MDYKQIVVEREGNVVTCRVFNPPLQVFTTPMMAELNHLLSEIENDDSVRVFVVTGTDGVFIRWMDLTEMSDHSKADLSEVTYVPTIGPIHELGMRIQKLKAVTVAAINGVVGGGGCEFSLSFDFRLMSADGPGYAEPVTFALPQTSFGLTPGGGGAWHCIRLLGRAKALDVLLHGEFMPPEQALELGLISRLYPAETYEQDVAAFVNNMAARAPLALQGVKRLVSFGTDAGQLDFCAQEMKELMPTLTSKDAQLALTSWLENPDPAAYNPQFTGE